MQIHDNTFGTLSYDAYWYRSYSLPFLGTTRLITLVIYGDEGGEFEDTQYQGFKLLESTNEKIMEKLEKLLFSYYQTICPEVRAQLGDQADRLCPIINTASQLDGLVTLKEVILLYSFGAEYSKIGFIFDAKWDPELGVGAKLTGQNSFEIGTQDIVL